MITEQDCIDALQRAARELGHAPSRPEYENHGFSPHPATIYRKIGSWNEAKKRAGLETIQKGNKRDLNSRYFSDIDSEAAYWLGFLYGDGSVTADGSKLSVGVQSSDSHHIEAFRDALDSNHAVSGTDPVQLQIRDEQMLADLARHGFTHGKTTSKSTPEFIDDALQSAFVRGLFDADGHIEQATENSFRFNITGSNASRFARLERWMPVVADIVPRGDGCFTLRVGASERLRSLQQWLYPRGEDTEPKLDRKFKTWPMMHSTT